jgi:hypothetical protein
MGYVVKFYPKPNKTNSKNGKPILKARSEIIVKLPNPWAMD